MQNLLSKIHIQIQPNLYLKDPESSNLGKKIIEGSVSLIHQLGFEHFTFKKLATEIQSTEASIYRYFESKTKVLLYLTNWYWSWIEYRLVFSIANIKSPEEKLQRAISLLTEAVVEDGEFTHINESILHEIILCESLKAYLNKEVDSENKEGAFIAYKSLVERISNIVLEVKPDYPYPHMLISTVIEGAHLQRHFAAHLPRLTNVIQGKDAVSDFYQQTVFKAVQ